MAVAVSSAGRWDRTSEQSRGGTGLKVARDVYELDPLSDARWPALVDTHPQASVFHTRAWLRALQATYGYRPLVLTTCSPGAPLTDALVFCEVNSWLTGRRLVSLPFSDHCEPLLNDAAALETLLLHARGAVEQQHYKRLEIRPHSTPGQEAAGFELKGGAVLHRLDITAPADPLFRSFHKDCIQRKIRRAERENLAYEEGNSEAQLNDFYRLMTLTRRRHGLPPQPLRWFRELIAAFGPDLKIRIVRKDGVAVASMITLSHRQTMVYKYGCSDASANKYGGTPMLFWQTIQEAKRNGQTELDMGRSDLDDPGLSIFKEHWGSVPTPLTYWRYPAEASRTRPQWQRDWTSRLIAASPDQVLQLAGNVLYRHMG
ncbi:MAG TPA: GNAT family N-acetyltransferase [Acidobacteriaceae bacterium]|jgi:CelD/BcsL family acetyltransferase involved in cellulose biosynthesis|nr:GNAT family N-acetyltransferase [Acidobacteriaceae bacterium]